MLEVQQRVDTIAEEEREQDPAKVLECKLGRTEEEEEEGGGGERRREEEGGGGERRRGEEEGRGGGMDGGRRKGEGKERSRAGIQTRRSAKRKKGKAHIRL